MNTLRLLISATAVVVLAIASSLLLNCFFPYFSFLHEAWLRVEVADLVVTNGKVYTADPALPFADSMAVRGGRVLRVGNYSSLQNLIGFKTKTLNLKEKLVVPGFIDSHVHMISGGLQMAQVQLYGVRQKDQFVNNVKEAVSNMQPGSWLLGGGWNNDLWGRDLPMASWIDEITPHNPVWLTRMDGHMGLANSVALKIAGITNYTLDPDGGAVMRDSNGEPTGLLVDSAMVFVLNCIPELSVVERRDALLRASEYALSKGVTTIVDMGRYFPGYSPQLSWEDFSDVYKWADSLGKMKARACLFFPAETWMQLHELIKREGRKLSEWIYLGGIKSFADGSLGSNSALFYRPYVDDEHNYGLQVTDTDTLYNMTLSADKAGLQVAVHAIGDKANDLILGVYKSVVSKNGKRDRRFRIEHAQHLGPGTPAKFGEQEVVASVQPDHLLDDADFVAKKLGFERANEGSYLFQSLLSSKALLALGSDWPVADINPLGSIKTAMKRVPPGWDHAWIPSQRLSLNDSLSGHTISSARGCFLDKYVGSLSPGKMADFVVLSADSWEKFDAAEVDATYVGGLRMYSRSLKVDA